MKITVTINGKPTQIELTADQVAKIKNQTVTERIKTFEDACIDLGISLDLEEIETNLINTDVGNYACIAFIKLQIIAKALNEGWKADWNNSSQYKYYPWFKSDGKSGFSFDVYDCGGSGSGVGSRLCYRTKELAEYAGKQFEALYSEYLSYDNE
ncbi:hypothetical protein [Mucilaginibacter sp.]|jgi:hypothetical protein|uniref:hypothetical protein n=1 Tax=Mucilaginibacter sp. TaxID=1882438 RepID=UPI0035683C88